jgi:outer membrane protein TolC
MPTRIAALILTLAAVVPAGAETLTLRSAMERARLQAREVTAARSRAAAAAERLDQVQAQRFPTISLDEIWTRTDSPAEVFAFQLNQERFSFSDFVTSDPNDPEPLDTAITRLALTLPIYTGGELGRRRAQAEAVASAAAENETWAGHQAAVAAAEAYVMLEQAREYEALLERARDTVAAHVAVARNYVEQGMLVRSELLRAEVELARIEDLLAEAQGRRRIAGANLAFRLGADQAVQFELEALPAPVPVGEPLESWLGSGQSRADLAGARRMITAAELEAEVQSAAYLPTVGVMARYDWFDDTLFGSNGDSLAVIAAAGWRFNLGGGTAAAVAAARHQAEAGRQDVDRFSEGVALEIRQAYEEAGTARARHATALRALEAAREAERITSERFASGVVKTIDVLDAATASREAQTRELVARAEAQLALLRLAAKSGRAPESVLP